MDETLSIHHKGCLQRTSFEKVASLLGNPELLYTFTQATCAIRHSLYIIYSWYKFNICTSSGILDMVLGSTVRICNCGAMAAITRVIPR